VEFDSLPFPEKNKFPWIEKHTKLIDTMFGSYGFDFPNLGFSILVPHFITGIIMVGK
jgi:hypothetical protein